MPDNKSHSRSTSGVELTDEVLDRMAREAEEGLDTTKLERRRGRPAMGSGPADALPVRLDRELPRPRGARRCGQHAALRRYLEAG